MAISKIIYKSSSSATGEIWMDATTATAAAADILAPKTAMLADGIMTTGTGTGGGEGDTYTRTIIVPQQTVTGRTPALTNTGVLVDGEYYIATVDGTEYLCTARTQWSSSPVIGDVSFYYSVPGEYDYPFAIGYEPGAGMDCALLDSNQHTIKVEHLEFVDGPLNLIEKTVTTNGTYDAEDDNADGYSSVTVNVSGGGGGPFADDPKLVFIDYDGSTFASYSYADAQALTALPANPSHTGLTAQGWNWTLQQIKTQLTAYPDQTVYVGQMYITASGDTEIDVHFADAARLSPILTIAVNGTVTVDWGDNTTADTVTGTSLTTRQNPQHTYAAPGDYTIVIHVVSGSFQFYTSNSYTILRKNTTINQNRVYANTLRAVRLGSGITSLYQYTFYYCASLASITIPSSVTTIDSSAFHYCYSLASITIPSTVTSIGGNAFSYCYSLSSITIPNSVTSIGGNALNYCYSLTSITIPSSVTSISNDTFYYCASLASITIPSTVTSIENYAFGYCYSLASITIPSSVTSIGNSAFAYCYGVAEYHILPTTVPTGGTTMFSNIISDCVIYVPKGKLTDYQGATNWSTYASYMQEAS